MRVSFDVVSWNSGTLFSVPRFSLFVVRAVRRLHERTSLHCAFFPCLPVFHSVLLCSIVFYPTSIPTTKTIDRTYTTDNDISLAYMQLCATFAILCTVLCLYLNCAIVFYTVLHCARFDPQLCYSEHSKSYASHYF